MRDTRIPSWADVSNFELYHPLLHLPKPPGATPHQSQSLQVGQFRIGGVLREAMEVAVESGLKHRIDRSCQ